MKTISATEAAQILDISAVTVKRWAQQCLIKGYKVGGRWRIDERSVLDYLERVRK